MFVEFDFTVVEVSKSFNVERFDFHHSPSFEKFAVSTGLSMLFEGHLGVLYVGSPLTIPDGSSTRILG